MAFIYGDLKTKLQTQIGDPNLNDSVAGDALNYTQQAIFGTFDLTLNSATQSNSVTTGSSTLASALPSGLERITALYISSPTALATDLTDYFISVGEFRAAYPDAGTYSGPLQWWTFFTSVEFAMKATVDLTIKIDYIKAVDIMSVSSDIPTIPQAYEELLMLGAKIRVYEQKEDFDYAGQFTNRYADLVEAFITRYSTRQVDTQIVIPGARVRVGTYR